MHECFSAEKLAKVSKAGCHCSNSTRIIQSPVKSLREWLTKQRRRKSLTDHGRVDCIVSTINSQICLPNQEPSEEKCLKYLKA